MPPVLSPAGAIVVVVGAGAAFVEPVVSPLAPCVGWLPAVAGPAGLASALGGASSLSACEVFGLLGFGTGYLAASEPRWLYMKRLP